MKKFCLVTLIVSILGIISFGCGHHHRRHYTGVVTITSSSIPSAPDNTTIIINQPAPYDQEVLINEILNELLDFKNKEDIDISVTIEVNNDINIDSSVVIDVDKIVVTPGHLKRVPGLYHWLCKFHNKKCKSGWCFEEPKPCDNEE